MDTIQLYRQVNIPNTGTFHELFGNHTAEDNSQKPINFRAKKLSVEKTIIKSSRRLPKTELKTEKKAVEQQQFFFFFASRTK